MIPTTTRPMRTLSDAVRPVWGMQSYNQRHLVSTAALEPPQLRDALTDVRDYLTRAGSDAAGSLVGGATAGASAALSQGLRDALNQHAATNPNPWRGIVAWGTGIAVGAAAACFLAGYSVGKVR